MKWLIISLGLLSSIPISDWLVEQQIRKDSDEIKREFAPFDRMVEALAEQERCAIAERAKSPCERRGEPGYTKEQAAAMNDFVAFQLKPSPSKMVYRWANKRAAQIAEAYSLRPQDLDKTVDVRKMK
ncbi:hypothetical protein OJF2_51250 [Aquisphaera giovannonii]|uniref:Uncharacterized protein n=1 Tax=Aquisphaera giovannonii TaxID=406548 RepID=A0A5B9W933_9BACT|nr:hypothetical protein [Aquisphaera giovannonii]QEH36541.1 hypothetical protein OJF2_51250 [Aquisphaera giovannonii]